LTSAARWKAPAAAVISPPQRGEMHVWRAGLGVSAAHRRRLERTLSADEGARAARLRRASDRHRFVVARGFLRDLLGRYLDVPPRELQLGRDAYGKPSLAAATGPTPLHFNLSHSADLSFCAVSTDGSVGADVERIQTALDCEELASRFYSPRERSALSALPRAERTHAFFACWTRKEAYLKARGTGLSLSLDGFDVTIWPDDSADLLPPWWIQECASAPGYCAAVAGVGLPAALTYLQWNG
jgi:4'-phosphopantetheinyl transferase